MTLMRREIGLIGIPFLQCKQFSGEISKRYSYKLCVSSSSSFNAVSLLEKHKEFECRICSIYSSSVIFYSRTELMYTFLMLVHSKYEATLPQSTKTGGIWETVQFLFPLKHIRVASPCINGHT